MSETLTTIECGQPGARYALFDASPMRFTVHLAAPSEHGTGPCLCGFDRFTVGFSVGGGFEGPGYVHDPCPDCASLIDGRPVRGKHARLFREHCSPVSSAGSARPVGGCGE